MRICFRNKILQYLFITIILATLALYFFTKKRVLDVIIESNSITDIYNYLSPSDYTKETLIIFDLDNTLIHPEWKHLGSDQWFYTLTNAYEKQGMSHQQAVDSVLPLYFQIMAHIWFIPVEENQTKQVVNYLQKNGVTVIALTARSLDIVYRTMEQLDHVGITFAGYGPTECPILYGKGKPSLYIHGIIFCGNYNKGEVLAYWLNKVNYHPKKVIIIDDKLKNILSVEKALHKRNYPFIGLRYGYLDNHIKTINQEIIKKELQEFQKQFPDARPITPMPAL